MSVTSMSVTLMSVPSGKQNYLREISEIDHNEKDGGMYILPKEINLVPYACPSKDVHLLF